MAEDAPEHLARLRAKEPAAFEELVLAHQHRVFGLALRMLGSHAEAEDIAQETFLRAHRALPEFRGEARVGTWLYGITARLCLNRLASAERRLAGGGSDALAAVAAGEPDAGARLERSELDVALHEAIAALPEERRAVVILRDVEGLSYEEIGQALALEPGTVRSRLHRARLEIKAKLQRFWP